MPKLNFHFEIYTMKANRQFNSLSNDSDRKVINELKMEIKEKKQTRINIHIQ